MIPTSPCTGVRLPKRERSHVVPLHTGIVEALAAAVPDRYRALVILAAGTGLRQGEALGLTLDNVDFLRRQLRVDQQLSRYGASPTWRRRRRRPAGGPSRCPTSSSTPSPATWPPTRLALAA